MERLMDVPAEEGARKLVGQLCRSEIPLFSRRNSTTPRQSDGLNILSTMMGGGEEQQKFPERNLLVKRVGGKSESFIAAEQ